MGLTHRTLLVLGPDTRLQPGQIVRVGHVERIKIQPGAPTHLGQTLRRSQRASGIDVGARLGDGKIQEAWFRNFDGPAVAEFWA